MGEVRIRLEKFGFKLDPEGAHTEALRFAVVLVTDVTRQSLNRAIVLTPVDTGNLRGHNNMNVRVLADRVVGEVFNDANYAAVVHDGSGPYIIRPRRRKALKFKVGGQTVFARKVHHPGTRGRPWIARAVQETAVPQGFVWQPSVTGSP